MLANSLSDWRFGKCPNEGQKLQPLKCEGAVAKLQVGSLKIELLTLSVGLSQQLRMKRLKKKELKMIITRFPFVDIVDVQEHP